MPTYGIDLGTTYSCIAYLDDTGRPGVVPNSSTGSDTTPSVVYFEGEDSIVVGQEAKGTAKVLPDQVKSLIKRDMGKDIELTYLGKQYTPASISAIILRRLAESAERTTGEQVKDVVITVPAYFGLAEREATRTAGAIAGLNVLNLVEEPVAAALNYGALGSSADTRTILVYDLGGGTFDTTVIRVSGNDINVVYTDGDHQLGGADWDEKLMNHLLEEFTAEHPQSTAAESDEFLQSLLLDAERLKKELTTAQSRRHNITYSGDSTRVELSRAKFEELTSELLDRTFTITRRTLAAAAERGVTSLDDVLLVGGSSRMPAVEAGLRQMGLKPKLADPDLAVAKGAALFAMIESLKISLSEAGTGAAEARVVEEAAQQSNLPVDQVRALAGKRVTTVVPRAFGVKVLELDGDREIFKIVHVLRANTPLPAETERQRFGTAYPDQVEISIEVWEQSGVVESPELRDNEHIAEGVITGMPPLPQHSPIDITFSMDETGVLKVYAVELKTGKDLHIELRIRGGMSDEKVAEARRELSRVEIIE